MGHPFREAGHEIRLEGLGIEWYAAALRHALRHALEHGHGSGIGQQFFQQLARGRGDRFHVHGHGHHGVERMVFILEIHRNRLARLTRRRACRQPLLIIAPKDRLHRGHVEAARAAFAARAGHVLGHLGHDLGDGLIGERQVIVRKERRDDVDARVVQGPAHRQGICAVQVQIDLSAVFGGGHAHAQRVYK